jgi:hypothetical protein
VAAPRYGYDIEEVFAVPEVWEEPEEEKKEANLTNFDKRRDSQLLDHTDLDAHSQMDMVD